MATQTQKLEPKEILDAGIKPLPENRLVVLGGSNENVGLVHIGELVRTRDDQRLEAVCERRHEIVAHYLLGEEAPVPSLEHPDDVRVVQPVLPPREGDYVGKCRSALTQGAASAGGWGTYERSGRG